LSKVVQGEGYLWKLEYNFYKLSCSSQNSGLGPRKGPKLPFALSSRSDLCSSRSKGVKRSRRDLGQCGSLAGRILHPHTEDISALAAGVLVTLVSPLWLACPLWAKGLGRAPLWCLLLEISP
jgi:hypothetical protein